MPARRPVEPPDGDTIAELIEQLGGISPKRIRISPAIGLAREEDVVAALEGVDKRLCELVDGVLIQKALGMREGLIAGIILHRLWSFLEWHRVGKAFGADAAMRLKPGLVRIPDVSFVSEAKLRGSDLRTSKIATLVPDLVVEVLSKGNTRGETERKLCDYFQAGVRLVWLIRPISRTAEVYHAAYRSQRVGKKGTLVGEDVLPGFALSLPDLFALADKGT